MDGTDVVITEDTCTALQDLLDSETLKPAHQAVGERLLARLTTDVEIAIAGPREEAKAQLLAAFQAHGLSRARVHSLPWDSDDPLKADLCVWCTTRFDADEMDRWDQVADRLKDHSFLVPVLASDFSADDLQRLETLSGQEFFDFLPMPYDSQLMQIPAKDIRMLIQEIQKTLEQGCVADEDNAKLFLQTHGAKPGRRSRVSRVPLRPSPFSDALAAMKDHLAGLEGLHDAATEDEFDTILTICSEASEAATEHLQMHLDPGRTPDGFVTELQSATDRIMLLSLEGGVSPTLMAVTTALQMRREIEMRMAS